MPNVDPLRKISPRDYTSTGEKQTYSEPHLPNNHLELHSQRLPFSSGDRSKATLYQIKVNCQTPQIEIIRPAATPAMTLRT